MTGLPDFTHQRMLAGVCLWLSEKLGWSVWGLRAAALLALWLNPLIAGIAYLAGGWWVNRKASFNGPDKEKSPAGKRDGRKPMIIDQTPQRLVDAERTAKSDLQADSTVRRQEELAAHDKRVDDLLKRYRDLDERLQRQ